jgi:DNA-binding PadR family transcriptional regulator
MSVRHGVIALLAEQPMHTYQVKQEFEERTGGTWPLNIGQVYTTLQRLVRDGLVEPVEPSPEGALEHFRLTAEGRLANETWWATPVTRGTPARDELVIKLALAVTAPGVDVTALVQSQRTETMRALRDLTRFKSTGGAQGAPPVELAWSLVLDNLIFSAEAEVRWLDHVEARVAQAVVEAARRERAGAAPPPAAGPTGESLPAGPGTTAADR